MSVYESKRLASIDQLRGFAVVGMIVVNYFGFFKGSWVQLQHHFTGLHYADTIAPLFVFVVGMGMRLSWLKRTEKDSAGDVRKDMAWRYTLLVLIAFVVHMGYYWDALMYIGLAGLLSLWFVGLPAVARMAVGAAFLFVYQCIFSLTSYGDWLLRTNSYEGDEMPLIVKLIPMGPSLFDVPINGGPIGFVAYSFTLLAGTVAHDLFRTKKAASILGGCIGIGLTLMVVSLILRFPWGEWKPFWPYSQYLMSSTYILVTTGIAFITAAGFYVLNDLTKIRLPHLTVFGMNPLFIYILHFVMLDSMQRFLDKQSAEWGFIVGVFIAFYALNYAIAYIMHRKKIYVKL